MEIEESMEVVRSEEDGIETPAEAPSETTPEPEVQPVEIVPETPAVPVEPELFETPDGRKVDAQTLQKEWKENFLPEFTRKSQELSELKKTPLPEEPVKSPYADPNYVPQSYEEIIKAAKEETIAEIRREEAERIAYAQSIETAVATQLEEVKKVDPNVNENQLFLHANKYGFRDLKVAHQNMKDMAELTKTVQKQTVANIQKRADPVSASPGASGTVLNPDDYATARDYIRALNGTK